MDPTDENPYPYQQTKPSVHQQLIDDGILPPVGTVMNALPILHLDGKRRLPSRAEVLAYREQVEAAGVPFELRRTLPDFTARVRRLSLTDRAAIGSLPEAMQGRVVQLLNATRKQGGGDKPLTINRLLGNVERQESLANVFCLHGFIEPRLVEDESQIADDETWLVTDIHPEDRVAFLNWCLGQDDDAAGRIKNFPDESGSDLGGLSPNGRDG